MPELRTIVYIGGFELPDRNAAAQRVRNNCKIFQKLGYKAVLIGTSRRRSYDGKVYPADGGNSELQAWEVGYPVSKSQWFDTIQADWPLHRLVEGGHVDPATVSAVVCYNYPAIAQLRLARLARIWGAKAFTDCTEWYGVRSWTSSANIIKNLDVALRMNCVNRRMDGIITTSPFMTKHYRQTGLPIVEIPTLIEDTNHLPSVTLTADGPLPLFATASGFAEGTQTEDVHDRIDWILELLDQVSEAVPPFVLSIAGVDRDKYLSVFPGHSDLLERLGERVRFLGRIERTQLLARLECAAFAFVLRHESRVTLAGFPSKYSEAITFGTPVIINGIQSLAAYHVEARTGFQVDTGKPGAAALALSKILNQDRLEIQEMKRYCRESRLFNSDSFVAPVKEFFGKTEARPEA